jgi:hypothetical protein
MIAADVQIFLAHQRIGRRSRLQRTRKMIPQVHNNIG